MLVSHLTPQCLHLAVCNQTMKAKRPFASPHYDMILVGLQSAGLCRPRQSVDHQCLQTPLWHPSASLSVGQVGMAWQKKPCGPNREVWRPKDMPTEQARGSLPWLCGHVSQTQASSLLLAKSDMVLCWEENEDCLIFWLCWKDKHLFHLPGHIARCVL